jgi:hypothetical protein
MTAIDRKKSAPCYVSRFMKTIAYPIVIAMLIAARQYTANAADNLDRSTFSSFIIF